MKMHGLFFGGLFWGLLIILIGVSMVMKHAFNIDFHLVRIFIGIIIVLFGIRIVTGWSWGGKVQGIGKHHYNSGIKVNNYSSSKGEYNIIFTDGTIDLTSELLRNKVPREINVVFGSATVLVPDNINLDLESTTVFGSTTLPNRSQRGFGEDHDSYVGSQGTDRQTYKIETNTVFGSLTFEVVPATDSLNAKPKPDSSANKTEGTF
jgi:predicted membrane protein